MEGGCRRAVELCGEKRSRPERMERMAKVKCWGGKDKQGEKEKEGDKQRETEKDGLKMATKSLNVVTKTSAAFYVPIQSVLVFFFCVCG